jgi:hypothetical protein
MHFLKTISQSRLLSIIFSSSITTLGELIFWIAGVNQLTLLGLISAPIIGVIIGLSIYEYKKTNA